MMSAPAGFEEVIRYADFKKEATVEDVDDDSTLEDEPDEEDLEDIISGNITLNVSRIIVLPDGELVIFSTAFSTWILALLYSVINRMLRNICNVGEEKNKK